MSKQATYQITARHTTDFVLLGGYIELYARNNKRKTVAQFDVSLKVLYVSVKFKAY